MEKSLAASCLDLDGWGSSRTVAGAPRESNVECSVELTSGKYCRNLYTFLALYASISSIYLKIYLQWTMWENVWTENVCSCIMDQIMQNNLI